MSSSKSRHSVLTSPSPWEKEKSTCEQKRSSIFYHCPEEPKQLWPGKRQVQNGNLYIGSLELKQETSACFQLVSCAAFVLTNPRLWVCKSKPMLCGCSEDKNLGMSWRLTSMRMKTHCLSLALSGVECTRGRWLLKG